VVEWIEPELIRVFCPAFADVFVRREASERFQPFSEVVGREEIGEVAAKLVVAVVMIAADGRLFQRAVHAFDLAVRPGMLGFCQPVLDIVFCAGVLEGMSPDEFASSEAFFELLRHRANIAGVVKCVPLSVSTVWIL